MNNNSLPPPQQLEEKLLVLRAQGRDEAAFRQLVSRYDRRLLYYIRRLLGNDCDQADILQEVWIRVFLKLPKLNAPEAFRVWLYKIAHDIAITWLRKQKRDSRIVEESHEIVDSAQDWDEFELLDRADLVHKTLETMSFSHREVLTLRFLESMSIEEIAEVVGCSMGTIKSRLHYAKSAMRASLEESTNG